MYSPGPAFDVLSCAVENGFAGATFAGPSPAGPPGALLFNAAEVELNAASIVLNFAQKNGFPAAVYFGGTLVPVTNSYGQTWYATANPAGITLPPPGVVG